MVHLRLENSGKCACFGLMIEFLFRMVRRFSFAWQMALRGVFRMADKYVAYVGSYTRGERVTVFIFWMRMWSMHTLR